MTEFLVNKFIKDSANIESTEVRTRYINTGATFINTDAIKMPTYGTKVPYNGHI